jgi:hypothetical protein
MVVIPFFVLVKECEVTDARFENLFTLGCKAVQVLDNFSLKITTLRPLEMSVTLCQSTRCKIPDDLKLLQEFYILLILHFGIILVNNQFDVQFFFKYVYFYSLHVSVSHVPIIRRIICINTTSDICHSVYMTVWCAGFDETASLPNLHTKRSSIQNDIYQMSY